MKESLPRLGLHRFGGIGSWALGARRSRAGRGRTLLRAATALLLASGLATESIAQTVTEGARSGSVGAVLAAILPLRSTVPATARTAPYLGTLREGSGLVIDAQGLILTIGYLILEAESVAVLVNGTVVTAEVIAYDQGTGLGLVRARSPIAVTPLRLGRSSELDESTPVLVASAEGQAGIRPAFVVSRRDFAGYWEYVLEDAIFTSPPHPRVAGSALLGPKGQLLGVGYLVVGDARGGENPLPGNMFVPIDRLQPILGELLAGGRTAGPPRPWLGLFADVHRGSILVLRVADEGPAAKAGIESGDVILGVGETPVGNLFELYRTVWARGSAGVEVPLVVLRGGEVRQVNIRSGNRDDWLKPAPSG